MMALKHSDYCSQKNGLDLLYLASCALHGKKPLKERIMQMNLRELYLLSCEQSLGAVVFFAIEKSDVYPAMDVELKQRWLEYKEKAVRKNILMDAERKRIFSYLEENGIWYMPLKGCIIKDLYPSVGMRQMADNDILFDSTYAKEVEQFFKASGYEATAGLGAHDIYHKPPVYNYEMHRSLFDVTHDDTWKSYYDNIKERLLCKSGTNFEYYFSKEDFYIYNTVHAYKHFSSSGCGLRWLIDSYVLCLKWEKELDWDYISRELTKLGIVSFEEKSRMLAKKLLEPSETEKELSGEELDLLNYCIGSSTYGTKEQQVSHKLQKIQQQGDITGKTKWKYYVERIFPSQKKCESYYPFFAKHRWLKPVLVLYRLYRAVFVKHKEIQEEIRIVRKS